MSKHIIKKIVNYYDSFTYYIHVLNGRTFVSKKFDGDCATFFIGYKLLSLSGRVLIFGLGITSVHY